MGPPTKGRWLWGEEEVSITDEPAGEAVSLGGRCCLLGHQMCIMGKVTVTA